MVSGLCNYGAIARPRTRGASDARRSRFCRRSEAMAEGRIAVLHSIDGVCPRKRPSPGVIAPARPSASVRCPRHESRLHGTRKTRKCGPFVFFRVHEGGFRVWDGPSSKNCGGGLKLARRSLTPGCRPTPHNRRRRLARRQVSWSRVAPNKPARQGFWIHMKIASHP